MVPAGCILGKAERGPRLYTGSHMTGDVQHATFLAAFPAIQSAIKVYGDNQGMRVQLDIPESEMTEALKLMAWRGRVFMVTIVPVAPETWSDGEHRTVSRRKAKERVVQGDTSL